MFAQVFAQWGPGHYPMPQDGKAYCLDGRGNWIEIGTQGTSQGVPYVPKQPGGGFTVAESASILVGLGLLVVILLGVIAFRLRRA